MPQSETTLARLIRQRHLSREEAVAEFAQVAKDLGCSATLSITQLDRLRSGVVVSQPRPATVRVLERQFGVSICELLAPASTFIRPTSSKHEPVDIVDHRPRHTADDERLVEPLAHLARMPRLGDIELSADNDRGFTADEIRTSPVLPAGDLDSQYVDWQVSMAARRAVRFSASVEGSDLGAETLDWLTSEAQRIATEYQVAPIHTVVGDLANLQDVSFRLLEGRQRPKEARELYVLAGIISGMMANASHDLGNNHAAITQARTAYVCADNADHDGLRAWVRGVQSMISYWAGWTHDAIKLAELGAEPAAKSGGTVSTWIPSLQARAWGVLGNAHQVENAIHTATEAREHLEPSSFDAMGGKLTFPLARQLYYAADANSWLEGKDRTTSDFAESAISAYRAMPDAEQSYVDQTVAQTDLALARAQRGELDGVHDAVAPVLDLTPSERVGGVIVNAARVGAALRDDRYRGANLANELTEELEGFTQMTAAAALNR
jgi:hypothetical protein